MNGRWVAFRADASRQIGTGHVMRCLALADELSRRGARCVFVCRAGDGNATDLIESRGHSVATLLREATDSRCRTSKLPHSHWLPVSAAHDARQTLHALREFAIDWLIVDHYALDIEWESVVGTKANRVLAIDDLADRQHDADLLLDQNLGRQATHYSHLIPDTCVALMGPTFALLRPEFARHRKPSLTRRVGADIRHVLINLGGMDMDDATSRSLLALKGVDLAKDTRITVVMGPSAPWTDKVRMVAAELPWNTQVVVGSNDMASLMSCADVAIGAAGTSALERCCLGLPTITWVLAANQRSGAAALAEAGCVFLLPESPVLPNAMHDAFRYMAASAHRQSMQTACAEVTDGLGACRVADMLEKACVH